MHPDRPAQALHPLLEAVFAAFDRGGLDWCLLRGEGELDAPADDVDVLVAPAQAARASSALTALGFARLPSLGRGTHEFFLGLHAPTATWIELDLVTEIAYGPHFVLRTHAEEWCLARRRRSSTLSLLAPGDAFWTLLLHCLLDKRSFAPRNAGRLQDLAAAAELDGPLVRLVTDVCPPGWTPARCVEAVREGRWSDLESIADMLERNWARRARFSTGARLHGRRLLRLAERPAALAHRRGVSVALVGLDGAGKSTLAAALQRSFRFPVRSIYMGLWPTQPRPGRRRVPAWLRVMTRPATIWCRYLRGRYHQVLGRLVVFDRYTYDAFLPPEPPLVLLKRPYFWILAHACPGPDLVVLLDVPGAVAAVRKPDETLEQLETQRLHFLALRGRFPGVHVVDAARPAPAVRAEVIEQIWRRYLARWAGA